MRSPSAPFILASFSIPIIDVSLCFYNLKKSRKTEETGKDISEYPGIEADPLYFKRSCFV
jgi:hypothetical protein